MLDFPRIPRRRSESRIGNMTTKARGDARKSPLEAEHGKETRFFPEVSRKPADTLILDF